MTMNNTKELKDLLPQPISNDLLWKIDQLTDNQKSQLIQALNQQVNQTYQPQQILGEVVKIDR